MPLHLPDKTGRAGGLSYVVRNITARHVPRGGAFLLHLGSTDQANGSARRGRLGSSGIPGKVHFLLGTCRPGCLVAGVSRKNYLLFWAYRETSTPQHCAFLVVLLWAPTRRNLKGRKRRAEPNLGLLYALLENILDLSSMEQAIQWCILRVVLASLG